MTQDSGRERWLRAFEARERARGEAGAQGLARLRREAIDAFAERGFPTRRDEAWRQTDVSALAAEPFAPGETRGRVSATPPGVRVVPLTEALARDPGLLETGLGRLADAKRNAFAALNTAFFEPGWLIEVAPGTRAEAPLELHLEAARTAEPCASHPRILLVAREGSAVTLVERYTGEGGEGPMLCNAVTELVLERDAHVAHVRLQEEAPEAWHVGTLAAHQERGSHLDSFAITLGGRLSRLDIETRLAAEDAECRLNGLYLAAGSAHTDHHTTIDHAMPHTRSEETYKGILAGRARAVFAGRIHVRPHAQKIAAEQSNRNLLLSDDASVHTEPQLEIHADDVRCSHGAAIGRLDEDALFYLRSRGIETPDARALLTFAFASEILERLPETALRTALEERIVAWLPRQTGEGRT